MIGLCEQKKDVLISATNTLAAVLKLNNKVEHMCVAATQQLLEICTLIGNIGNADEIPAFAHVRMH